MSLPPLQEHSCLICSPSKEPGRATSLCTQLTARSPGTHEQSLWSLLFVARFCVVLFLTYAVTITQEERPSKDNGLEVVLRCLFNVLLLVD